MRSRSGAKKKNHELYASFSPSDFETKKTNKSILELLESYNGQNINQYATGNGPYRRNYTTATFECRDQALRAATRLYVLTAAGTGHWSDGVDSRVDDQPLNLGDFEDLEVGEDIANAEIVTWLWQRYQAQGGRLGRVAFIIASLATEGGIARVYFEEGLKNDPLFLPTL